MMNEYLEIGSTPCDEDCTPAGSDANAQKAECQRYIDLLRTLCGTEPDGASLAIKGFRHDFGMYYEVICRFDSEDENAVGYAFHLEANCPARWNETEKRLFQPVALTI